MLHRKIEKLRLKITSYISRFYVFTLPFCFRSCWHKALLLDHAPDVFLRGSPGTASTGIVLLSKKKKKTCIFKKRPDETWSITLHQIASGTRYVLSADLPAFPKLQWRHR
ncbi:hypothetical protein V6N13_000295 [Hibiscus sabdariffa]